MTIKSIFLIIAFFTINLWANAQTTTQTADYVINTDGTSITALPRPGTTLVKYSGADASTVIQSVITALTPTGGGAGSGGGHIHIGRGVYFLNAELTITGWENTINPFSKLVIEGDGQATQLVQNTAGKNAFVIKNCASFTFKHFRIYTGSGAKSCLLADSNGSFTEWSCNKSVIDDMIFYSNSTSSPAVYLKNFFGLNVGFADIENTANHALILENASATTNFGNSNFSYLRCVASTVSPYAGLLIRTTNPLKFMNMLSFGNYECVSAYYGIYSDCLHFSQFSLVDIEGIPNPVYFTGAAAGNETRNVTINSGYIFASGNGTSVTNTLYTAGNQVTAFLEGESTVTPVVDASQYRPTNGYQFTFGTNINQAKANITSVSKTAYVFRKADGSITENVPSGATGTTAAAGDNSTTLATTAFVQSYNSKSTDVLGLQALGSGIKAATLGMDLQLVTDNVGIDNGTLLLMPVYLPKAEALTGVKVVMQTAGVYTATTEYNGVGLYSISGGVATQVASSASKPSAWTAAANTVASVPFTAVYNAPAGVYYVALAWNRTQQTTAPRFYGVHSNMPSIIDMTLGRGLRCKFTAATLPANITMTSTQPSADAALVWVY